MLFIVRDSVRCFPEAQARDKNGPVPDVGVESYRSSNPHQQRDMHARLRDKQQAKEPLHACVLAFRYRNDAGLGPHPAGPLSQEARGAPAQCTPNTVSRAT